MAHIRVQVIIAATPGEVWASISDISSHVQWMDDAVAIHFLSEQRDGVGTRFHCDTRIGPFTTVDTMEVIAWEPERVMAIRHKGLVKGEGSFTLRAGPGGTEFTWDEDLTFPGGAGGRLTATAARPVLHRVWRKNLTNLKRLVEAGTTEIREGPA